jgi:hypothetical protein
MIHSKYQVANMYKRSRIAMKKIIAISKESEAGIGLRRCVSVPVLSNGDMPERTSVRDPRGILTWIENVAVRFLYRKDQPRRIPIPFSKLWIVPPKLGKELYKKYHTKHITRYDAAESLGRFRGNTALTGRNLKDPDYLFLHEKFASHIPGEHDLPRFSYAVVEALKFVKSTLFNSKILKENELVHRTNGGILINNTVLCQTFHWMTSLTHFFGVDINTYDPQHRENMVLGCNNLSCQLETMLEEGVHEMIVSRGGLGWLSNLYNWKETLGSLFSRKPSQPDLKKSQLTESWLSFVHTFLNPFRSYDGFQNMVLNALLESCLDTMLRLYHNEETKGKALRALLNQFKFKALYDDEFPDYCSYVDAKKDVDSKKGAVAKHDFMQGNEIDDAKSTKIWEDLREQGVLNKDGSINKELDLSSDVVEIELSPEIMGYKDEILTVLRQKAGSDASFWSGFCNDCITAKTSKSELAFVRVFIGKFHDFLKGLSEVNFLQFSSHFIGESKASIWHSVVHHFDDSYNAFTLVGLLSWATVIVATTPPSLAFMLQAMDSKKTDVLTLNERENIREELLGEKQQKVLVSGDLPGVKRWGGAVTHVDAFPLWSRLAAVTIANTPTAPFLPRSVVKDLPIGNTVIPKGSILLCMDSGPDEAHTSFSGASIKGKSISLSPKRLCPASFGVDKNGGCPAEQASRKRILPFEAAAIASLNPSSHLGELVDGKTQRGTVWPRAYRMFVPDPTSQDVNWPVIKGLNSHSHRLTCLQNREEEKKKQNKANPSKKHPIEPKPVQIGNETLTNITLEGNSFRVHTTSGEGQSCGFHAIYGEKINGEYKLVDHVEKRGALAKKIENLDLDTLDETIKERVVEA